MALYEKIHTQKDMEDYGGYTKLHSELIIMTRLYDEQLPLAIIESERVEAFLKDTIYAESEYALLATRKNYKNRGSYWWENHLAEQLTTDQMKTLTKKLLSNYYQRLNICIAIKFCFDCIGKIIEIDHFSDNTLMDIEDICAPIKLNELIKELPQKIVRYGTTLNEKPADTLKAEIAEICTPIDVEGLYSITKETLTKATRLLSFSAIKKNGLTPAYHVIRDREDKK